MNKSKDNAALRGGLPETLVGKSRREARRVSAFGGMDTPFGGGEELEAGMNLSPRREAPWGRRAGARGGSAIATRKPRGLFAFGQGEGVPHGMVSFDGAVIRARGTGLYRTLGGTTVSLGTVSDTPKQFVSFGDRLYIYPDKLYLERGGGMPKPLELDTGVIPEAEYTGNTVTLPKGYSWGTMGFIEGDSLRVISADDDTPAPEGYYRILKLQGTVATVSPAFPANYTSDSRFLRSVPALERCCVCGERVYGVAGRDIYVSAAGSATDFFTRPGSDGLGALHIHTDTEGDFTALSPWQGYVVFFKEGRICRLLGSRADSMVLQDNRGVGIPSALADTLCEVGDALYYCAAGGVYRYRGQEPQRVCPVGEGGVSAGCGGTDGHASYLSAQTPAGWRMSLYLPEAEVWYPEDSTRATAMLTLGGFLAFSDGEGKVWLTASDGRSTPCVSNEITLGGIPTASATLATRHCEERDGFRLTGLCLRASAPAGSTLRVYGTYTAGEAVETCLLGEYAGGFADRLLRVPVIPRLCDGVTLRLDMAGEWVIHEVLEEYETMGKR